MNDSVLLAPPSLHEEAARYALLRRLTPTLRHHMAGEFQPIGMMAALLERRVQQPSPDLASLKDNCVAIGNLSRNAAQTCVSLMSWVAPRPTLDVTVSQGVTDCVNLLSTSLRFRGFALSSEVPDMAQRVSCTAMHSVLPAALLALSDSTPGPADMKVQAHALDGQVRIDVTLTPADRSAENRQGEEYRPLHWDDVRALATAENVDLQRTASGVQLTLHALRA